MKLLQTYYTSCPIGQTGSSGFQFYSFSDGITEKELDEIGKLGSYIAPFGSNPFPTADEVLNVLPVAFKYFCLSSGRVGVLQSTACTQEYTGRTGNYFTHALILDEGKFPFMPILWHKNKSFMHDLTCEQKNIQSVPPLLPALVIDERDFYATTGFSIPQFIRQGQNQELLSKLLDIALAGKDQKKRIILADHKPEEIIYALSHALPFKNVMDLTFSTYSLYPDAEEVFLSASRSEGSNFNFDDANKRFEFHVFDNGNGRYAELENQSEFSKISVALLASDPRKIDELYAFSEHFTGKKDAPSMDLIATIYSEENFAAKWKQILPFVTYRATPGYPETFLSGYRSQIVNLVDALQSDDDTCIFLENMLQLIRKLQASSAWLDTFFTLYQSTIVKRLDMHTKSFVGFSQHILTIFNGEEKQIFLRKIISQNSVSHFAGQADSVLAGMNVFAFIVCSCKILFGTLNGFGKLLSKKQSMTGLVTGISEEDISPEHFQALISEVQGEMDLLLLGIAGIKAERLVKRFICELTAGQSAVSLHEVILKGLLDHPVISDDIRNEVVGRLEKKALTQVPSTEELNAYARLKRWTGTGCPAISLIQARRDAMMEQMGTLNDARKLSVFLEWKSDEIIPGLKRPEDWKRFYQLTKYVPLDTLNRCVKQYSVQATDTASIAALVTFAHGSNDKQMDDMLRQIMASMKRSTYNSLKHELDENQDDVSDYFTSLNKGIHLKRLFNFKF